MTGAEDKVQLCGYLVSKGDKDFVPTQKTIAAVNVVNMKLSAAGLRQGP